MTFKSTFSCALVFAAIAATPLSASAGFSLPGFGAKTGNGPDINVQQTQLVTGYVAADKEVLTANSRMAEALGLKDAAAASAATADSLTEGATKGNLEDADKAQSTATTAVSEELKKGPKLDAQAKSKFGEGLGDLARGVLKYVALRQTVQDFSTGLKGASPLDMPKLRAGAYVVSSFPTNLKDLGTSLRNAVAFARNNDIPVPSDATQAMAAL